MKLASKPLVACIALAAAGCATIIGHPDQLVSINSTPSDAAIAITDEKGVTVFKGMTPTSVTLAKSSGRYWGGKDYVVTISKPGFETQTIPVQTTPNGWYIAGNLLFGGLIGWFIVDPFSGNMYTLSPDTVTSSLSGAPATHNNTGSNGSIAILLLEDVPPRLRDRLKRIN